MSGRRTLWLVVAASMLALAPAGAAASDAPSKPGSHGTLRIAGVLRDGNVVRAVGLRWSPGPVPAGQRVLSFEVGYTWSACPSTGPCAPGGGSTWTPFAASRYRVAQTDVGRRLRLVETATEVVQTVANPFTFRVIRVSRSVTTRASVGGYPRGRAPTSGFVNGLPERSTGSDRERFQVSAAHYNPADGVPALRYRLDSRAWRDVPPGMVISTGRLHLGRHTLLLRTANRAGATTRSFSWRIVPLPRPLRCAGRCWYPPHLDRTGRPMRWDWQIGLTTPLQRTGVHAVDIYDVDGHLTTAAELHALHTSWQAATLPHPKAVCYLDLAWEDYRPDGSTTAYGGAFPAATLGKVYYGYPEERWVDFRQLRALEPMLDHRIAMCAHKGFDAVELDDIDSYDPPTTTGFQLTRGDVQNYLAWAYNDVHRHGMTALWKNSGLLSWWGRRYTEGAVVEECYTYGGCFSASLQGSRQYGFTCSGLSGPTPCGYDDFTADRTRHQPTGKWVGESEYRQDGFVCAPGQSCAPRRLYATYCRKVWGPPTGFAAIRLSVDLDASLFQPCPAGR